MKKSCKLEEHKDMEKTGLQNLKDSAEYTSQDSSSEYSDEEDDDEMDNQAKAAYLQYSEDDSEIMRDSMVLMRESGQPKLAKKTKKNRKR